MKLRCNARVLAGRLRRYQEAIPGALARAASPAHWKPRLELAATKALRAQWVDEREVAKREFYEALTPRIVQTLVAQVFERGVRFALGLPEESLSGLGPVSQAAAYNQGIRTPSGRTRKYALREEAQIQNLEDVRQTIIDWVMLEKHRNPERDSKADGTPLSDEEIAGRIAEILGVNERAAPRARTAEMDAAAAGLTKAIEAWMAGEGETPPTNRNSGPAKVTTLKLEEATAAQWFTAVLLAWKSILEPGLPARAESELQKVWQRVSNEML